ncbi:MAG: response regulator transcription factor [Anaerolineales bacterium]
MIKVLIVDDHRLLIDGLCPILESQRDIKVIGTAKDGLEAIEQAQLHLPDIILLDISLPHLNGLDAARKILDELPDTKIIMLSMHADKRFIRESIHIGARGYLLKESAISEVISAIQEVQNGGFFFSHEIENKVIQDYVKQIQDGDIPSYFPLTPREREVLQLLAEGKSTREVASLLVISIKTVESHRKQIMDKLGLHSIAELTKYAIRAGLTQLDQL